MIVKENYTFKDGRVGTKTYSDNGFLIKKVGTEELYTKAIDVLPFEYEETNMTEFNEVEDDN